MSLLLSVTAFIGFLYMAAIADVSVEMLTDATDMHHRLNVFRGNVENIKVYNRQIDKRRKK